MSVSTMWKDVTTYSQREPRCAEGHGSFEWQAGVFRVCVSDRHIHFPGQWVMNLTPLFRDVRPLNATTLAEAKVEAVVTTRDILGQAMTSLEQA
jgi:hypothetical protein